MPWNIIEILYAVNKVGRLELLLYCKDDVALERKWRGGIYGRREGLS